MGRRENRRIHTPRHQRAQARRRVATDDHLQIRQLQSPLFERELQGEIVGAAEVEDIDPLAAQIVG
jgi:hypothetical protein